MSSSSSSSARKALAQMSIKMKPDSVVGWVIRAVLLVFASVIVPHLPEHTLSVLNYSGARFVFLVAIAAMSFWDPASAILLAVAFVVGIQTLSKHKVVHLANEVAVGSGMTESFEPKKCAPNSTDPACYLESFFVRDGVVATPPPVVGAESMDFTTPAQFENIQNNLVDKENQDTEVRTWTDELGPQGLSAPYGSNGIPTLYEL